MTQNLLYLSMRVFIYLLKMPVKLLLSQCVRLEFIRLPLDPKYNAKQQNRLAQTNMPPYVYYTPLPR